MNIIGGAIHNASELRLEIVVFSVSLSDVAPQFSINSQHKKRQNAEFSECESDEVMWCARSKAFSRLGEVRWSSFHEISLPRVVLRFQVCAALKHTYTRMGGSTLHDASYIFIYDYMYYLLVPVQLRPHKSRI